MVLVPFDHLQYIIIKICYVTGAFFNGVFLLALALSILLQSIQRFIHVEPIESPLVVLVVGAVGLTLNIISAIVVHGEAACRFHSFS